MDTFNETIDLVGLTAPLIIVRPDSFGTGEITMMQELDGTAIDISDENRRALGLENVVAYRIPPTASAYNLLTLFTSQRRPIVRVDGQYIASDGIHRGLLVAESPGAPISPTDQLASYLHDPRSFPLLYQQFLNDLRTIDPEETTAVVLNIGSNVSSASSTDAHQQQNPAWWKQLVGYSSGKLRVYHLDHFTADGVFAFSPSERTTLKEHFTSSEDRSIELKNTWSFDDTEGTISGTTTHLFYPIHLPSVRTLTQPFQEATNLFYRSLTEIIESLIAQQIPVIIQNNAIFTSTVIRTETNIEWEMFSEMKEMVTGLAERHRVTTLEDSMSSLKLTDFLQVRVRNISAENRSGTISEYHNGESWESVSHGDLMIDDENDSAEHKWKIVTKIINNYD